MTKPIPYRQLVRLLRGAGFVSRPGKGDHEFWSGPNGAAVSVVHRREGSAAVHRAVLKAIARSQAPSANNQAGGEQ